MRGFLAREWSLWNQVNQGYGRFSNEDAEEAPVDPVDPIEVIATQREYDDKHGAVFLEDVDKKKTHVKSIVFAVGLILLGAVLGAGYSRAEQPGQQQQPQTQAGWQTEKEQQISLLSFSSVSKNATVPVHEVIEIPVIPDLDYGTPVFEQSLLNASFGNSWGHPAIANYTAPPADINFTQVVLTLDLWVAGVQYDRLLHVYLGGSEVWRSSTPEPAGRLSHTHAHKDVSVYNTLFKHNQTLMFQLDNLLTSRLTGVFNVTLDAHYYYSEGNASLIPHEDLTTKDVDDVIVPGASDALFKLEEGASKVVPLVGAAVGRPPLVYVPDAKLVVTVPKVSKNTTRVKLLVYTSGNAEEEFWYTNLDDEFKDRFKNHGHTFGGHGPCRVINVYHEGLRIASANPMPVIYTGGMSPALWNPIVSTGAYDVRPIDIDITNMLPYLWEDDMELKVDVSNCVDDDLKMGEKPTGVGSNWISSANLAIWESPSVLDSTGEILNMTNSTKVTSFVISPPFAGLVNQIVNAKYTNQIRTQFNVTLKNGTALEFVTEHYDKVGQTNIQIIKSFGDSQSVISVPNGKVSWALLDPVDLKSFFQYNTSHSFPITSSVKTKPVVGPETEYQVNVTKTTKFKMAQDGTWLLKLEVGENGTSNYTLSPDGNHGIGTMEHNLTLQNSKGHVYNRHALGSNFTIVYDNTTIINATTPAEVDPVEVANDNFVETLMETLGLALPSGLELISDDPDFAVAEIAAYRSFIDMIKDMPQYATEQTDVESTSPLFRAFIADY